MCAHYATILGKMYMHTLARFCESQRRFFSLLSLKYITYSFSFRLSLLPAAVSPPRSPPPPLPQARGHPRPSLLLPSCLLLVLRSCLLCVPWLPCVSCCVLLYSVVSPSVSPSPWLVPCVCLLRVRAPEALRRSSVCPAVCPAPAVTRQPSGAKRCDSVGRCTACMSPALSPLAYVLPCVPWLVLWLVLPAAVCRLVVTIACTPLY